MNSEYEHMEDAFRDKLRDLEISAPEDVWEGISAGIAKQPVSRKFMWYKVAASVAAIAVVGSLFWTISQTKLERNSFVSQEIISIEQSNKVDVKEDKVLSENVAEAEVNMITPDAPVIAESDVNNRVNTIQEKGREHKKENSIVIEQKETREIIKPISPLYVSISNSELDYTLASFELKQQTEKAKFYEPEVDLLLAFNNTEELNKPESKDKKWTLGGDISPLYSYRNITKSDAQFDAAYYNSVESPIMTYSGGLNVQYKALGRLSVQAGVYYTSMGQSLDYMSVYSNKAYEMVSDEYKDRFLNAYDLDNSAGSIRINTSYVVVDEIAARVNDLSSNKGFVNTADPVFQDMEAEIQQSFRYIEVPVLLRYKLIDRLIDFNIVGGLGANFLIGNDVILTHGNKKEIIGETKGVDPVNYTSSLGFGIEYPLMKGLNFRLEPSIKYYLNAINSSSSIESHPYSIGVYTGINYTF